MNYIDRIWANERSWMSLNTYLMFRGDVSYEAYLQLAIRLYKCGLGNSSYALARGDIRYV
jgi:hypothetical protein